MRKYHERWGRFFVKMIARTTKLKLNPVQGGRYMSDVVKAYTMGLEAGYMNRKEKEKSKEIKAEGFSEPKRNVAVISLSISDFNMWKLVNGLKSDGMGMPGRFTTGNTTFFNISDPCDSISLVFDAYAETEQAKKNKKYDRIMLYLRGGLK